MKYHQLFMDCAKLLFLNVFLYSFSLGVYLLGYLTETRWYLELPLRGVFLSGIVMLISIIVWISVAHLLYGTVRQTKALFIRALYSEGPFIVLWIIMLLWWIGNYSPFIAGEVMGLFILFAGYLIVFPAIMVTARAHREHVEQM